MIGLSYRSTDPQQAAAVVNVISQYYLENNIQTNRAQATATRKFLNKQLPEVEARVLASEAALRRFKDANQVVALEEEAKAGVDGLKSLSQAITTTQADLVGASTRSQALQKELALNTKQAIAQSSLSQSPAVQQVLTEYQKTQDELAVARTKFQDQHPKIIDLKNKVAVLKSQLGLRVETTLGKPEAVPEHDLQIGQLKQTLSADLVKSEVERLGLANRVKLLQSSFVQYQGRLSSLPKLEQQLRQLMRQLQVAQSTYEQLFKKLQEVAVLENQDVGNARVVSEALIPDKPVSPKIPLNLALGGFLGLLLGVGTALMLEAMDRSVKTVDEAKRIMGYPLVGTIPQVERKAGGEEMADLPVLNNPYSAISSAFEMLQTNLSFTLPDKVLRTIVVTSSVPGEGKSFVAANLAVVTAQMGRRVLLIDADMRRSRQHEIWQMPNLTGLSNVLVDQSDFDAAAQKGLANLDVLTAGTKPPNPAALLDSQRIAALIQKAGSMYDFVIIDAPPLTAVGDALMLGKSVDGILMVTRPGVVDTDAADAAKGLLMQSGHPVLGMVVNGVTAGTSYGGYYGKQYYGNSI